MLTPRHHWLFLAGAALLVASCQRTFVATRAPSSAPREHWAHFYVFGWYGEDELDARDVCGARPAVSVQTGTSTLTWVLTIASLGVYSPRTVTIRCEGP